MSYSHRHANYADLPRIVDIYNIAVESRTCSCDLDPISVEMRQPSFAKHTPGHRPFWVARDDTNPSFGIAGYLSFSHFMNERPGYFITAEIAIYLHPEYQRRGLGTYLLRSAMAIAPALGIETLTATIFATNQSSLALFGEMGFERWGYLPRVARLEHEEKDLVIVGKRVGEPVDASL